MKAVRHPFQVVLLLVLGCLGSGLLFAQSNDDPHNQPANQDLEYWSQDNVFSKPKKNDSKEIEESPSKKDESFKEPDQAPPGEARKTIYRSETLPDEKVVIPAPLARQKQKTPHREQWLSPDPKNTFDGLEVVRRVQESSGDLEIRVWKSPNMQLLEANVNMKGTNQSVLPVDNNGRIKKDILNAFGKPYLKIRVVGEKTDRIFDLTCDAKVCRALWPKFPYEGKSKTKFQFEIFVRGRMGHKWQVMLNQLDIPIEDLVETPVSKSEKIAKSPEGASIHISQTRASLDWFITHPLTKKPLKVLAFEEWEFQPYKDKASTEQMNFSDLRLVQILKGPIAIQLEQDSQFGTEQIIIPEKKQFWLRPGLKLNISAPGDNDGALVRVVEFVNK